MRETVGGGGGIGEKYHIVPTAKSGESEADLPATLFLQTFLSRRTHVPPLHLSLSASPSLPARPVNSSPALSTTAPPTTDFIRQYSFYSSTVTNFFFLEIPVT